MCSSHLASVVQYIKKSKACTLYSVKLKLHIKACVKFQLQKHCKCNVGGKVVVVGYSAHFNGVHDV